MLVLIVASTLAWFSGSIPAGVLAFVAGVAIEGMFHRGLMRLP